MKELDYANLNGWSISEEAIKWLLGRKAQHIVGHEKAFDII